MHPDLDALRQRYQELYDAASAGHISAEDALSTLTALSVTDGSGAVWAIDPHGNYTRAAVAGGAPAVADPAGYIGPETVTSNPETGQYDIGAHPDPSPWPAPGPAAFGSGTAPTPPFEDHMPDDPFAGPPAGAVAAAAPISRPVAEPKARSLADAGPRSRLPKVDVLGLVTRNKFLLVIAVIAAVLVGATLTKGDKDGGSSTIPETSAPDAPANPAPQAPKTDEFVNEETQAKLPTATDLSRVLAALEAGDRATVPVVVAGKTAPADLAHAAAFFAGLDEAGLTLVAGEFAEGTVWNTATQRWQVNDGTKTVLTIPVTWQVAGGTWKLAAVPTP